MPAAAIIGGALSVVGGIFGSSRARREARRRENQARALEYKLNQLEENRQEIIDPYENITDLRTAAMMVSIKRIAQSYGSLGI